MGLRPGLRFGKILTGWMGLAGFWLALLLAGTIGAGVLHKLGPPDVASAGRPQPSVSQTPAPAILLDSASPAQSGAPAIPPAIPEARADAPAAATPAKDPHSGTASLATAPQSHTGSSLIPAPLSVDSPIGALSQVAMQKPASSSAVPQAHAGVTNSSNHPVDRMRVIFHYLVDSPIVDAAAKRLSAQLGVQTEMLAEATVPQSALVRYVSSDDHAAAQEAGKVLGEMGYSWQIEITPKRPGASSQRGIEIWLPTR